VLHPVNAAHLALRCLQLPRLGERLTAEIGSLKERLGQRDREIRAEERRP
jgi:hypothetical protein